MLQVLLNGNRYQFWQWDRMHEHLASKRHERLKQNFVKRMKEGKQLTLFETEVRAKSKERESAEFVL